jgi:hypothetical protein
MASDSSTLGIALVALMILVGVALADERTEDACVERAFQDYNAAVVAIMPKPFALSKEFIVAKRRLREQFCRRFTACPYPTDLRPAAPDTVAFHRCLRMETHEYYDAD